MAKPSAEPAMVFEDTWEEVVRQGTQLAGRRVRLEVFPEGGGLQAEPFYRAARSDEWSRAFDEWAASHVSDAPPLSDYAVSRESIYGELE